MRFEGKIAIVTGGTSGIGLAAGERLLAENSTVVLADVHEPNGPAADRLRREPRASFVHCDVTDASAVDRLAEQVFAAMVASTSLSRLPVLPTSERSSRPAMTLGTG
jgi:NAD(P)-dependent dehydrogenase (short-subunit alcohol dehydrogenase family)